MPIIEVSHLTKEYSLGHITSLKQNMLNLLARVQGKKVHERERFKALNDVSFSIEAGEVVGIIGHNGAGKSTLLKHLANISSPTKGTVAVRGSVAPLIEVGAGVNPELTGRENIFLNGAILGIPKKQIKLQLNEIIEFSELEQFIDTPVKRYSSGMTVKLGFSIATSMHADVLVIDEVLAVGDLAFQRKCFDRMEGLIKNEGKTVLLVSHNLRQIERLCSRAICLDHGEIVMDDIASATCNYFYEENDKRIADNQLKQTSRIHQTTGEVELISCFFIDDSGNQVTTVEHGSSPKVLLKLQVYETIKLPTIIFGIHTTDFVYITTHPSPRGSIPDELNPGIHEFCFVVRDFPILAGVYGIRICIDVGEPVRNAMCVDNVSHFIVQNSKISKTDLSLQGFFALDVDWD